MHKNDGFKITMDVTLSKYIILGKILYRFIIIVNNKITVITIEVEV